MTIKKIAAITLIAGGLAASGTALAQSRDSGWYIGGGIGQSKGDIDVGGINAGILAAGRPTITSVVTTSDDTDTGFKIFGGYQFNRNFALEVGYADLGKFSFISRSTPPATFNGEVKLSNNWYGDIVGSFPLGHNFSILGRIGILYSEGETNLAGTGPGGAIRIFAKEDDVNYKFGFGLGYDFTPQLGLRGEWERYRVTDAVGGNADVDLWSVSLRFKF